MPRQVAAPYDLVNLYPYKPHAWNAQRFVSDLEARHLAASAWLEEVHWTEAATAMLTDGRRPDTVLSTNNHLMNHHLHMTAQEVAVHQLWLRHRTVFDIHPGLTEHLRSSDSDKFPPLVLQNLPYLNPLVFLGSPVEMEDPAGKPMRLLGWYVSGMTGRQLYRDTGSPEAHSFHLTLASEVLSADRSQVTDWDFTRITLPITGDDATVGEVIQRIMDRFTWDPSIQGQTVEGQKRYMSDLLYVVVPHMLYLVSQTLESKPKPFTASPPPRKNKWDRKQGGGRTARQLVGYESGPVLASLKRWDGEEVEPKGPRGSDGTHRSPVAHVRRAHFHTYRTGVGRTERVVKWLAPIPINAGGSPQGTQAVKVR